MPTGLRKLIYIPNEEIWQGIQIAAKIDNRSVSNYLVTLHQLYAQAGDPIEQTQPETNFFNPQPKGGK